MIKSIHKWINNARRWIVSFGALGFFYLITWLSNIYKMNFMWYFVLVPFLYLLSVLLEKLLFKIVYQFSSLRQLILDRHFIEGYWIEVLSDRGKMDSIAILQIIFEPHNQYTIKGESYTLSGEYRGSFVTPNTSYHEEEMALRYSYSGKMREALIAGTGILEFGSVKQKNRPDSFSGHLIDNFHVKGAAFVGEKINDLSKVKSLLAKKEFMRAYITEKILVQRQGVFR
jgi:hypothetical protein